MSPHLRRCAGRAGALGLAAALLSGCLSGALKPIVADAERFAARLGAPEGHPPTRALDAPPPPIARPSVPLAGPLVARDLIRGGDLHLRPSEASDGQVEVAQSDGCVWRRADWFAPSAAWRGCGDSRHWRDGRARVSGGEGLWPLRPGAETRWSRQAVSGTGRTLERDAVCRVVDAVAVLREARAPTPAFVVRCEDGKRVRTTWYAPGEGPVAFHRRHRSKGVEEAWIAY